MKEDQFLSAIEDTAGGFENAEHKRDAVRATLQVLGQRLAGGETKDLASNLPGSLRDALPSEGGGERFGIDEFYDRVAAAEGHQCTHDQARQHARAVMAAIKVAAPSGELDHVASQLPSEYDDLLGVGPIH